MSASTHTRLTFIGDVMPARLVNEALRDAPSGYPWGDTLLLFQGAHWRCCNLEYVRSNHVRPWTPTPKKLHFRSGARNVTVLKAAGINAVSLANNHTLDFEVEALKEMIRLL